MPKSNINQSDNEFQLKQFNYFSKKWVFKKCKLFQVMKNRYVSTSIH